jgi:hypothetical protein
MADKKFGWRLAPKKIRRIFGAASKFGGGGGRRRLGGLRCTVCDQYGDGPYDLPLTTC